MKRYKVTLSYTYNSYEIRWRKHWWSLRYTEYVGRETNLKDVPERIRQHKHRLANPPQTVWYYD